MVNIYNNNKRKRTQKVTIEQQHGWSLSSLFLPEPRALSSESRRIRRHSHPIINPSSSAHPHKPVNQDPPLLINVSQRAELDIV